MNVRLTSYGFIRREDLDFKDDGNSFKGYEYKGIIFSYLNFHGDMYLSGRFYKDRKEDINLDLLKFGDKIRFVLGRFNGFSTCFLNKKLLESYCKDLDKIVEEIKEYNKLKDSIKELTIYKFKDVYLYNQTATEGYISDRAYKEGLVLIRDFEYFKKYFDLDFKIVELIEKK